MKNTAHKIIISLLCFIMSLMLFSAVAAAGENTLVLVTCENESSEGGYLNRRVVFAGK